MTLAIHDHVSRVPILDLTPDLSSAARQRMAWRDLVEAARLWRLCVTLAWLDIRLRYRGSMLGPFWLTLSTAAMVGSMGVLYAVLFDMNLQEYLPFLALSLVLWGYLSSLVTDGCMAYTVRRSHDPLGAHAVHSLHAARVVVRNLMVLAHNVVVIVAVYALMGVWPGAHGAAGGARHGAVAGRQPRRLHAARRDLCALPRHPADRRQRPADRLLHQRRSSGSPSSRTAMRWLLGFNPFFTLLEVVRGPLLGEAPRRDRLGLGAGLFRRAVRRSVGCCSRGCAAASRSGCSAMARDRRCDGVSVDFPLYHGNARSLKRALFRTVSGRVATDPKHRVVVQALRDISFRSAAATGSA